MFSLLKIGIYDDISFIVNSEFFLYDHDQFFRTRIYLDILDDFDMIKQQEQDIVRGYVIFISCHDFLVFLPCERTKAR